MDTRHSGRNTYDESDIQFILEILRTQNGNFNVSELARTLRELRPRHTYWSYQSFLTKNLRSGMNLMAAIQPHVTLDNYVNFLCLHFFTHKRAHTTYIIIVL